MIDSFRKIIKMGANISTFKGSSSARSSACISSSTGASLMELLKPACLRSEKGVRKRPLTPEKKKTTNVYSTSSTKKENISGEGSFTSLGDWLTSSPGSKPDSMNGGELYVLRSHYSSRRVHPSSSSSSKRPHSIHDDEALSSKARDSFPINRSTVKNEDDNIYPDANLDNMSSSLRRNQSGNKSKKRVSFRLPEEADIVIFYPSEEMFIDCEENFVGIYSLFRDRNIIDHLC